jgi:hypothetical protein
MTWDGKLSGKLPDALGTGWVINPAANLFGTPTDIYDRGGNVVVSGNFGVKSFAGMWADDEMRFCQMVPFDYLGGASGTATTLQLVSSNGVAHDVAKVGVRGEQTGIDVAACSLPSDRAVVVQTSSIGSAAQYWVVRLSTGRVLWTHDFQGTTDNVQVVASRDGMYVAENVNQGQSTESTVFGPAGNQVAHLTKAIEAFSWDGTLAVTDAAHGIAPVKIITWRDGKVVWTGPARFGLLKAVTQPDGTEFAIWMVTTAQSAQPSQTADVYVVSSTGKVVVHIANT